MNCVPPPPQVSGSVQPPQSSCPRSRRPRDRSGPLLFAAARLARGAALTRHPAAAAGLSHGAGPAIELSTATVPGGPAGSTLRGARQRLASARSTLIGFATAAARLSRRAGAALHEPAASIGNGTALGRDIGARARDAAAVAAHSERPSAAAGLRRSAVAALQNRTAAVAGGTAGDAGLCAGARESTAHCRIDSRCRRLRTFAAGCRFRNRVPPQPSAMGPHPAPLWAHVRLTHPLPPHWLGVPAPPQIAAPRTRHTAARCRSRRRWGRSWRPLAGRCAACSWEGSPACRARCRRPGRRA